MPRLLRALDAFDEVMDGDIEVLVDEGHAMKAAGAPVVPGCMASAETLGFVYAAILLRHRAVHHELGPYSAGLGDSRTVAERDDTATADLVGVPRGATLPSIECCDGFCIEKRVYCE